MLWSYTKREQATGDAPQKRPLNHLHEERRFRPSTFQRRADDVVLEHYLQALGEARRKFAPSLNLLESVDLNGTAPQGLHEDIRRCDCILHREIDTDSTDRRHCVSGIAYAEQSRPIPATQSVHRDRQ